MEYCTNPHKNEGNLFWLLFKVFDAREKAMLKWILKVLTMKKVYEHIYKKTR